MTVSPTRNPVRRIAARCLIAAIPLLVMAACRQATELTGTIPISDFGGPVRVVAPAVTGDQGPGQMSVAHMVPGFGGYFIDADQVPAVYLTNSLERPLAEIALRSYLRSRGLAEGDLRVLPARYTWNSLEAWYRAARASVFAIDGVVDGTADPALNRLRFAVTNPAAGAQVMGALTALDIPPGAAVVELAPSQ